MPKKLETAEEIERAWEKKRERDRKAQAKWVGANREIHRERMKEQYRKKKAKKEEAKKKAEEDARAGVVVEERKEEVVEAPKKECEVKEVPAGLSLLDVVKRIRNSYYSTMRNKAGNFRGWSTEAKEKWKAEFQFCDDLIAKNEELLTAEHKAEMKRRGIALNDPRLIAKELDEGIFTAPLPAEEEKPKVVRRKIRVAVPVEAKQEVVVPVVEEKAPEPEPEKPKLVKRKLRLAPAPAEQGFSPPPAPEPKREMTKEELMRKPVITKDELYKIGMYRPYREYFDLPVIPMPPPRSTEAENQAVADKMMNALMERGWKIVKPKKADVVFLPFGEKDYDKYYASKQTPAEAEKYMATARERFEKHTAERETPVLLVDPSGTHAWDIVDRGTKYYGNKDSYSLNGLIYPYNLVDGKWEEENTYTTGTGATFQWDYHFGGEEVRKRWNRPFDTNRRY